MNIKNLFHRPEKFTDYDPKSPAAKAARKWDEREGEIIEQNYNLRRILLLFGVVIVMLGAGLTYKATSDYSTVYVVETDIKTGEIRNIGTAAKMNNYQPTDQMYAYFIKQFVSNIRTVPLDEVVFKNNLNEAYGFVTTNGASILQDKLQNDGTFAKLGHSTVQVEFTNILPMDGGKSYQVRWNEVEYGMGNGKKVVTPYTGVFTVEIIKAKKKEQLDVNPLGIYITDMRWEKDNSTAAPTEEKKADTANAPQTKANTTNK